MLSRTTGNLYQEDLDFYQEAKEAFENNQRLETYTNNEEEYIALRYGADRDCIKLYKLDGEVAFFNNVMENGRKVGFTDEIDELKLKLDSYEQSLRYCLDRLREIDDVSDLHVKRIAENARTHHFECMDHMRAKLAKL